MTNSRHKRCGLFGEKRYEPVWLKESNYKENGKINMNK